MKNVDDVFEIIKDIIPQNAKKIVFFCEIEKKAYEIYFYSFLKDGTYKQCYDMVNEGLLDDSLLEKCIDKMAALLRDTAEYDPQMRNVFTIYVSDKSKSVQIEKYDRSVGLYKIKKEWKESNLE